MSQEDPRRPWTQRAVAAAPPLTVVLLWAFELRGYFAGRVPFLSDVLRTDLPMRHVIQTALAEGRLPQWFPYEGVGMPFIGNAEGLFRPFTLLYLLPDLLTAVGVEILASYLAGVLGAYLLGRALSLGRPASAALAVLFAFSGYSTGLQVNLPYLAPLHTMPWVLWAATHTLRSARPWAWVAPLSALWTLVLLGGDPLLSLFVAPALLTLTVAERAYRRAPHLLASGVLMTGLSAVWVLPAFELFKQSVRLGWVPNATRMALRPERLPELVLGGFWPSADEEMVVKHLLDGNDELWARSIYVGPALLALAALAVWTRRRAALPWVVLGLAFLWLSMGSFGGLHTALRAVFPLLDSFRYPEKYLSLAVLSLAIAAGHGLEVAATGRELDRWIKVVAAALALTVAVFGVSWLLSHVAPRAFGGLTDDAVPYLRRGWSAGLAAATLFLAALFALVHGARRVPALWIFAPVLLYAELAVATRHHDWTVPRAALSTHPVFCRAAQQHGLSPGHGRLLSRVKKPPLYLARADAEPWLAGVLNLMEPDASALCGLESVAPPNLSGTPARLDRALHELGTERVSRLANVALWVIELPEEAPAPVGVVARSGRFALNIPPHPVAARAWFGPARWVDSLDAALTEVRRDVEGALRSPLLEGAPRPTEPPARGLLRVESYRPEEVVLRATLDGPGAVVLGDLPFPGWTAFVDGSPVEIFSANVLSRAVLVPTGNHEVRFVFEMPRLATGLRITLAAVAVGLVLSLWGRRRTAALVPKG